ncbi:STAS domain-containing protein [Streptomyces lavendofoliae]|uniref:STAS domain-containing protein n=1 Tax=Streptomyces lavendofoliae TaxID=67314 RepID=UPI003D931B31
MTSPVDGALELRATPTAADTVRITVAGDLAFDTYEALLAEATDVIKRHPHLRHLHLDLAELSICDSLGLSALLQIERFTSADGARLHLDNRPPALDRLLAITGTYDRLVREATDDQSVPGVQATAEGRE